MSDLNKHDQPTPVPAPAVGILRASLVSRRRFARAGVAVPVVLTMASLPVHAAPLCLNPSGFISQNTNLSRHPGSTVCSTMGPVYWAAAADDVWPGGAAVKSTFFNSVFGGSSITTLIDVVTSGSEFDKYCVAAFLNAKLTSPPANFPLTLAQARGLWGTIKGSALPTGATAPNIPVTSPAWDEATAVRWLKTVMP